MDQYWFIIFDPRLVEKAGLRPLLQTAAFEFASGFASRHLGNSSFLLHSELGALQMVQNAGGTTT
jgi:hypothetical protein